MSDENEIQNGFIPKDEEIIPNPQLNTINISQMKPMRENIQNEEPYKIQNNFQQVPEKKGFIQNLKNGYNKFDLFLTKHFRLIIYLSIIILVILLIIIIRIKGFRKAKNIKNISETYKLNRSQIKLMNQKLICEEELNNLRYKMDKAKQEDKDFLISKNLI